MTAFRTASSATLLLVFAFFAGCHSAHVAVTVENRTGAPIELLEVDYPSASFGADRIESGADFHYRIQVRLSGPVKVQYTEDPTHAMRQSSGPNLYEGQNGQLEIVLLPGGKVEFHPHVQPEH
ncbi:MAG TPA: hypothetical protein VKR52_01955 [Terracidiphilus sp.]|nr:hypothetical protein [Terracidiphilus sp.]